MQTVSEFITTRRVAVSALRMPTKPTECHPVSMEIQPRLRKTNGNNVLCGNLVQFTGFRLCEKASLFVFLKCHIQQYSCAIVVRMGIIQGA